MKKAGEKAKSVAIHIIFLIIVVLGLYFIATHSASITGNVVLNASTAKASLESALSSSTLLSQLSQSSICVVINDATQPLSLQAAASSSGWTVSETKGLCSGSSYEDFIVQFPDYDSFSDIVDSPSPKNIAKGAVNRDFEILPSKYVELGGNVLCDATFKVQYCTVIKTMATSDKMIDGDLSCCIDKLTRAQKKLLKTHLDQGYYKDEQKILEQPTTVAGMSIPMMAGLGGVALLLIAGITVFLVKGHKPKPAAGKPGAAAPGMAVPGTPGTGVPGVPAGQVGVPAAAGAMPGMPGVQPADTPEMTELRDYVKQAMGEGYAPEDVRTHLIEIGWTAETADKIIGEAYQQLQQGQ